MHKLIQTLFFIFIGILGLPKPSFSSTLQPIEGFGDVLGISPFYDWKTIETDHFRVTFPSELSPTAQKCAQYLEQAHRLISPELQWSPKFRTQVLIIDNSDLANGMASAVQRFGIILQVTPPESWFNINAYDDWLRLLTYHEYTHILNMDPTKGLYEAIRILIGDMLLPNSLWPSWMLEGLAVYMETRMTSGGRGRSSYWEMILRTAVNEKVLDDPKFVTLDKVNGDNPYYPTGDTAYLFGYQLMNQVGKSQDDALGEMSIRSASRVPYFINGNLENITQKDWPTFWSEFVSETNARMQKQISQISQKKITPYQLLTETGYTSLGSAVSPNGVWLAYTQDSSFEKSGLYLRNIESGQVTRLMDRLTGVSMSFSPDSESLYFSQINRNDNFYLWSDLWRYNLKTKTKQRLTWSKRAKDPDVSRDGKYLVFSITEQGTSGIALADISQDAEASLSSIRKIYWPHRFDRCSHPKFSPDGKSVVFSVHRNGSFSEELISYDFHSQKIETLASGGFNRFPAFDTDGQLYFISDRSGVDNLYRISDSKKFEMISNVISGLWLPAFSKKMAYVNIHTASGWNLAEIQRNDLVQSYDISSLTVSPPPAPPTQAEAVKLFSEKEEKFEEKEYSLYPSLLPRQWAPILFMGNTESYVGGQILGYDATDRHRYILGGAYSTLTRSADWLAFYSNRVLGPNISFLGLGTNLATIGGGTRNRVEMQTQIAQLFRWTQSSLEPFFRIKTTRDYLTRIGVNPFKYFTDIGANYSDTQSSRLAIESESGRISALSGRYIWNRGKETFVGALEHSEFFHLGGHFVLSPQIQALRASNGMVSVSGASAGIFSSISSDALSGLSIHGYPRQEYLNPSAVLGRAQFTYPIWEIHRGWSTHPIFFERLFGTIYGETAYLPGQSEDQATLPAVGAGLTLSSTALLHVPLDLKLNYDSGLKKNSGGKKELYISLNLGSLGF